jgi:hypothetical protein
MLQGRYISRWLLTVSSLGAAATLLFTPAAWAAGRDPDNHGDAVSAAHSTQASVDRDDSAATSVMNADRDDTTRCANDPDAHGDAVSAMARTDTDSATDPDAHGDAVSKAAHTAPTCAMSPDPDDAATS